MSLSTTNVQTLAIRARRLCAAGLFVSALLGAGAVRADSFSDGQAAFANGEYIAAVEHFATALAAEPDNKGPLAYNLGVAAYRAGDYERAEEAFLVASTDPDFVVTSLYNLGLVDRKRGRFADARIWFKQVARHPNAERKLRRLADKAIDSLPQAAAPPRQLMQPRREARADILRFDLYTGYGTDSNVYRSPSSSYVDRSDPAQPTIDPVQMSGSYVPVDAIVAARWDTVHDGFFKAQYAFAGRFYTDEELSNADEERHKFSFGGTVDRKTRRGSLYWSGRFDVERHNQTAYDRDTGEDQVAGLEDVSERFNYTKAGPRVFYERELGHFAWGFKGSGYIRNYEETLDYLNLSHEQYSAGLHFAYRPLERTQIRLSAGGYQRLYLSRVAKDINGIRFIGNDDLEYEYLYGGLMLKQYLTDRFVISADARYTERTDVFEGYDDYERTSARVALRYRHPRFKVTASVTRHSYDYPNAFAFDDPTFELLTLDTTYATLEAEYRITRHFALDLKYDTDVVESNDSRSEFDRSLTSLSLRYRF